MQGPQCRYAVGSILSEGETKAEEEILKRYEMSGFNVFSFPEVTHVVNTSYPHRTLFSVLLGVRRVYPRLERYIKVLLDFVLFILFTVTVLLFALQHIILNIYTSIYIAMHIMRLTVTIK